MTRGMTSSAPRRWPLFSKSSRDILYICYSRVSSMAPAFTRLPALRVVTPPAPWNGGIRRRPRSRPCIGLALEIIRQLARVLFRVSQDLHQEAPCGRIPIAKLANQRGILRHLAPL
jgi:hypothetical protein